MKIVKSFKLDPHPAIIPFHSFIITPSYALITMYVELLTARTDACFRRSLSALTRSSLTTVHRLDCVDPG